MDHHGGLRAGCADLFPCLPRFVERGQPGDDHRQANWRRYRSTVNDNDCSLQFDPIGKNKFDSKSCDIAKSYLAKNAVSYTVVDAPAGTIASVKIGDKVITAPDPSKVDWR